MDIPLAYFIIGFIIFLAALYALSYTEPIWTFYFIVVVVIVSIILAAISKKVAINYSKYSINNKELILYSDIDRIIIKYYDIVDMWIDEKSNNIIIDVNEELKKTGTHNPKLTKEYIIICSEEEIKTDFYNLLNLSKLKLDMTREESNERTKEIMNLYKSESLNEF